MAPEDVASREQDEIWREPARGGHPQLRDFGRSGLEQARALIAGELPRPPISHLTGMRIVEAEEGTAAFEMPATGWMCSPQGAISIGPLAMLADGPVAVAVQTVLPPATPFTTAELSLRLMAPVRTGSLLSARGRLIQARRRLALADFTIHDEAQQLVGHGSSLCFLHPQMTIPDQDDTDANGGSDSESAGSPDPFQRPVMGEVVPNSVWEQKSGLEVLLALLASELPAPPIHYLTGLSLAAATPGEATFTMPATEWLCAPPPGRVQGGAVGLLAEAALSAAIQTKLPARTALAPMDLKVNYLRPLAADGRLATGRGRVAHAGRRIAVANSQVLDADGKTVALATGSAMILEDRPASLTGGLER